MKKKGFTLIELLAVIIILAVIALIATPVVLNTIEDSKRSAAEDSAMIISKAAETHYMSEAVLEWKDVEAIDLTKDTLEYKGEKPDKGYIIFNEDGNAYLKMYTNGYCVESNYNGTITSKKTESSDCAMGIIFVSLNLDGGVLDKIELIYEKGTTLGELPTPTREDYIFAGWYTEGGVLVDANTVAKENLLLTAKWVESSLTVILDDNRLYDDGEEVYFNPITNSLCSNYTTSNSVNGFRGTEDNGCLKWYAFLDSDDDEAISLLLDHNTSTSMESWENAKTEIANVKDNNLYGWHADVRSTARMISAEEVNEIAPYSGGTWTSSGTSYYFHTGTKKQYRGIVGSNKYAWLFDNLLNCEEYGCNVGQSGAPYYWTSTAFVSSDYEEAWNVWTTGFLSTSDNPSAVRPVLEVSKDRISPKITVTYGETFGELPEPIREGYTFAGWYTTSGIEVTKDTISRLTTNSKLYAQWQANTYTVTFKNGTEVVSTKTVTYGEPYGTLPPDQVKDGYLFKGWKKNNYTAIDAQTLVTTASNHDIEAILVEITYLAKLYFNPVTNSACTELQYNATTNSEDNFVGTTDNGCMLWYAYKEENGNYLMISDHNTTRSLTWDKAQTEIANVKDNNLYGWHEEVRSTARLISAVEVNELTRVDGTESASWDITDVKTGYYLHTGTSTPYIGLLGTNKYAWLFDNTNGCEKYGCNVEYIGRFNHWTSDTDTSDKAWIINTDGGLKYSSITNLAGIRPVISVPKTKFTT